MTRYLALKMVMAMIMQVQIAPLHTTTTQHYTSLHNTVLHCTTTYYTALDCTTLHNTSLLCTTQHNTALLWTTLYNTATLHSWKLGVSLLTLLIHPPLCF